MGREVWVPMPSGPLAPFAAGFAEWLRSRLYSPSAVASRLWQLEQLSRWLGRRGLGAGELTGERAVEFANSRRQSGLVSWSSPQSVGLPLAYLREVGVVAPPAPVVAIGPVEELLDGYRRYLFVERRLSGHTVDGCYVPTARVFLESLERSGGVELERLSAADVSGFLAPGCAKRSVSGARDLASALRSFLRFLHLTGLIELPLVWAVPPVANRRDRSLPRGLEPAAVEKLLASCDRRRTVGRRDYAVLLLLARLGLRRGEVAAIRLEDIDWRAGELVIHGKGSREDVLPLPVDLGEAIVSWLRRRPRCASRALLVRMTAPRKELTPYAIGSIVREACTRAGLPRVGAHRLRHTAATEMLRRGGTLSEIAQVLRHSELKTTTQYAKVDRDRLRTLARPWPSQDGGGA